MQWRHLAARHNNIIDCVWACFTPEQQYFGHIAAVVRSGLTESLRLLFFYLPTQGIFNLSHHIYMMWEKLAFESVESFTLRENRM
jgi:hypothetical protein